MRFLFVALLCCVFVNVLAQPTSTPTALQDAQLIYANASALFAAKEFEQAAKEFERANQLYPDPSFLFNAAMSYYRTETYETDQSALALFQQFLKTYPASPKEQLDNAKKKLGEILLRNPPREKPAEALPASLSSAPLPVRDEPQRFCVEKKALCWVAAGTAASFGVMGSAYWFRFGIPRTEGGVNREK